MTWTEAINWIDDLHRLVNPTDRVFETEVLDKLRLAAQAEEAAKETLPLGPACRKALSELLAWRVSDPEYYQNSAPRLRLLAKAANDLGNALYDQLGIDFEIRT